MVESGDFDIVFVKEILYFVKGVLNAIHVHLQEVTNGGMGAGMGCQGRPEGGRSSDWWGQMEWRLRLRIWRWRCR